MLFRWWVAIVAAALAVALISAPASAAQPIRYVALGDSSAAGPMIPDQIDGVCLRSDHNWPHVLAGKLGAQLVDATCTGAKAADLADSQLGALSTDTDLVTLAIGANDIDLGAALSACTGTSGPTCRQRYSVGGVDQYVARIAATAPTIASALAEIHRRSPHAVVVVVGYLTYWRSGGCWPSDPMSSTNADYIQATFDRLMAMLAAQAAADNAYYADIRTPSVGHGLCEASARRWVEGAVPASPAYPYHPNSAGMANVGTIIAKAFGR